MKKIIIFCILVTTLLISGCNNTIKELKSECVRLGYENLTDYDIKLRSDYVKIAKIECDNEVLSTDCYNREKYEWDKWGNIKVTDHVWECNKGRFKN